MEFEYDKKFNNGEDTTESLDQEAKRIGATRLSII